jgi:16S rRNA (cytidine1402-2'-O)-methyltransferase
MVKRMAENASDRPRGYRIRGQSFAAPPLEPGLYVVATPIGNLSDVTLRALDTLAAADLVACEDTRVTRRLLERYSIDATLRAYHEHSAPGAHRRLLDLLAQGKSVALVSDAGTPLVSDPGALLVADAIAAGYRVIPIPGASALPASVSACGLPTDAILFLGFLPSKSAPRSARLSAVAATEATLVFYESPHRLAGFIADAAHVLGGERRAVVCRELSKIHEEFSRGSLAELSERYAGCEVKGEVVVVIAPPPAARPPAETEVDAALREALLTASVKEAAQVVAAKTGLSRRSLYQRALALKSAP